MQRSPPDCRRIAIRLQHVPPANGPAAVSPMGRGAVHQDHGRVGPGLCMTVPRTPDICVCASPLRLASPKPCRPSRRVAGRRVRRQRRFRSAAAGAPRDHAARGGADRPLPDRGRQGPAWLWLLLGRDRRPLGTTRQAAQQRWEPRLDTDYPDHVPQGASRAGGTSQEESQQNTCPADVPV